MVFKLLCICVNRLLEDGVGLGTMDMTGVANPEFSEEEDKNLPVSEGGN